jgi:hypothetical protein
MALLQIAMNIGHNYTLAILKWYHDFSYKLRYFSLLMFATLEFQETLATKNGSVVLRLATRILAGITNSSGGFITSTCPPL